MENHYSKFITMLKQFLLTAALVGCLSSYAEVGYEPLYLKNLYAVKITPNGKWMGSMAGGAQVYDITAGKTIDYSDCFLGLGNTISDNGVAVGDRGDIGVVMKDGIAATPPTLRSAWFCDINAITPDGSRLTGLISNPTSGPIFVPFYCDIDDEGNVGEPVILPYPEKDFFNVTPQYVTAVWISDDGNTILGQVQDDYGAYEYPIVYKCSSAGEWSYSLPSESLFNPNHLEILPNPWVNEPPFPEPVNFMYPESRELFEQMQEEALMGLGEYPDPLDFMTAEQEAEYREAIDVYNEWYYSSEAAMKAYLRRYLEIVDSSVQFGANDLTLHPSGEYFACAGIKYIDEERSEGRIYKFSTIEDDIKELSLPLNNLYPSQYLPDGTIVASLPQDAVPTTYLCLPGSEEFIPFEEYLSSIMPLAADWMKEFIPGGTGLVCINSDMTVFAGGLIPYQLANYSDNADYYYSSYIIDTNNSAVEEIEIQEDLYKVFNLQGVNIMTTGNKADLEKLPKGLYIINGKKIIK